jgi:hypothetical protein
MDPQALPSCSKTDHDHHLKLEQEVEFSSIHNFMLVAAVARMKMDRN